VTGGGAVGSLEVVTPRSLEEALRFLAGHANEGWIPLAGGTDLLVLLDKGAAPGTRWLNLAALRSELDRIDHEDGLWRVGGLTTMTGLRRRRAGDTAFPGIVAEAAAVVGGLQIQNRATVAGNIANASPAGDTLPVWAVLEAEIVLASRQGERRVPYHRFHRGYREIDREGDELIVELNFRMPQGGRTFFHKVGTRAAQAVSKVVLAGWVKTSGGRFAAVRLAAGSVAPVPVRLRETETALTGAAVAPEAVEEALEALARDIRPIDDVRSTAAYRTAVTRNLLRHYLLA